MPELVANYIPDGREIVFHSENGILGMGPEPGENEVDYDLINAGKKPVTMLPGGAFFHHADSFGMIRGGRIDICVLGAFQISAAGDLANWSTGGPDSVPAVGGAMDLAVGARRVFVMTDHNTKKGDAKKGDAEAQFRLGVLYEEGDGVEKDFEKAVKLYRLAADQGHTMAQGNLGWMYTNGNGVEEDLDEAAKWYRRSEQSRKAKNKKDHLSSLR